MTELTVPFQSSWLETTPPEKFAFRRKYGNPQSWPKLVVYRGYFSEAISFLNISQVPATKSTPSGILVVCHYDLGNKASKSSSGWFSRGKIQTALVY